MPLRDLQIGQRKWSTPVLTDVDDARRINSFVGNLTDTSFSDPTTS